MIFNNTYTACAYFEQFGEGEDSTRYERIQALAYLIKTGVVWQLNGMYGRNAAACIRAGYISKEGDVLISEESIEE